MKLKKKLIIVFCFILLCSIVTLRLLKKLVYIDKGFYNLLINIKSPLTTSIFKFITECSGVIAVILMVVLILLIKKKHGLYFLYNIIFILLLNLLIKNIVMRERPIGINLIEEGGYSFPSGHSMTSVAAYGMIIYYLYKSKLNNALKYTGITISTILTILIPISRVYLGVHFLSDIVAGACISIIWLMFYTEYLNKRLLKKNDKKINEEYI